MNVSKRAFGVVISMVLLSIFFANVANLLTTNALSSRENTKENYLHISNKIDNLIWFLQISDIHISIFQDSSRITEFKEFCHYAVNQIKPSVVLASGDLTDAKTKDAIGSQQYEQEWKHYRDIVQEYIGNEKTVWLDIRGNHDNFNVAHQNSKQNFFTNYSVQGKVHPRSYMTQLQKGNLLYSFVAVDACLEPGPRRPFNFVGILDQAEINEINQLIDRNKETGSNYTIWFGHFPTSCILSSGNESVRELIQKDKHGLIYVCGHLHKLGGLIPNMYALQKEGFLELELGDWKDNRVFRLIAIDHGLLSFVDVRHRDWPIALITNPKHSLFVNPVKENLDNMRRSSHIRVLAFSLSKIDVVRVRIDEGSWMKCQQVKHPLYVVGWDPSLYDTGLHKIEGSWMECQQVKHPLYVVGWDPSLYDTGLHKIEVYVRDVFGREKTDKQPFSLDGTRMSFDILPRLALMSNASAVFQAVFLTTLIVYILPLCIVRYLHVLIAKGKIARPKLKGNCARNWLRKIWLFTTVDRVFWPVVMYPAYLAFGPWSIGYIVEDHIGVIFSWGIFVNGAFLPGSFTYAYGFIQLVTFQIPLTCILANCVDYRVKQVSAKSKKKLSVPKKICLHFPFTVVFTIQVIMAYLFWLAYGTLAFILGPLRTWSLVLAAILYYVGLKLPEKCAKKAIEMCFNRSDTGVNHKDLNLEEDKIEKSK